MTVENGPPVSVMRRKIDAVLCPPSTIAIILLLSPVMSFPCTLLPFAFLVIDSHCIFDLLYYGVDVEKNAVSVAMIQIGITLTLIGSDGIWLYYLGGL